MIVLIAEDMPLMRQLLKNYLQSITRRFIETESMAETERAMAENPDIDLIALDLRFPDCTSDETIERIRHFGEINPRAIIIVITGNADPTLEEKAIKAGAHGFMFKPAVRTADGFLQTLSDVAKSLIRQPTKYMRNLELAEKMLAKIAPQLHPGVLPGDTLTAK